MAEPDGDLASLLAAAVISRRDEINASRLAQGESGRVEIHVNLAMRKIDIEVLLSSGKAA